MSGPERRFTPSTNTSGWPAPVVAAMTEPTKGALRSGSRKPSGRNRPSVLRSNDTSPTDPRFFRTTISTISKCRLSEVGTHRLTSLRFRPQSYSEILEAEVPFLQNNELFSEHACWNLTEPWPSDNLVEVTLPESTNKREFEHRPQSRRPKSRLSRSLLFIRRWRHTPS